MDQKIDLEYTPKMEKALREIAKEDKRLFAEIAKKIGFLQNGELEKLDLSPIHRKHGKHQINEIRIKTLNPIESFTFASIERITAIF